MLLNQSNGIRITTKQIAGWQRIPNTSIQSKPLIIYHNAFDATPSELAAHLEKVGAVSPQWTYTMYNTTHYHSTTHEVLGVVSGRARLCFGGEGNPNRFEPTVGKGDLIIVPAGVGHRLLVDLDAHQNAFKMLGAYPPGKQWDMCYGKPGEEEKAGTIKKLAWFHLDPLYGRNGPVLHV
ncbi:hypothetical protein MAP00_004987 [Monascus purpureus]|nr:hypothetical protein MAP00_004987 [Monascus purpureus]